MMTLHALLGTVALYDIIVIKSVRDTDPDNYFYKGYAEDLMLGYEFEVGEYKKYYPYMFLEVDTVAAGMTFTYGEDGFEEECCLYIYIK